MAEEFRENTAAALEYRYHPMQMHLHTCYQAGGSMEGHIANAASLGMRYIRFTDHDNRMGPKEHPVTGFDFTRGTLRIEEEKGRYTAWVTPDGEEAPECAFFPDGTVVSAYGNGEDAWTRRVVSFTSSGERHSSSLLAYVTLTLGLSVSAENAEDCRVILAVRLSQRPPENKPANLLYCIGSRDGLCGPDGRVTDCPAWCGAHAALFPLAENADGYENPALVLPLSEIVKTLPREIGGLDNAFAGISLYLDTRKNGKLSLKMTRFSVDAADGAQTALDRQRVLADEIGARYGVKPYATMEISAAGQHKNCFSTCVPVIDYAAHGWQVSQSEAVAHVRRYGGIFAYNHPFERYKRMPITDAEIPFLVERDAAEFIASRVFGASLIEIGYPDGRGKFSLAQHLRLWDLLSLGGVFITGYGDSDSHGNHYGWFGGNNFAVWVASDRDAEYPIPEEVFNASLRAGRVYTGDPTAVHGDIAFFSENGYPTGSIQRIRSTDRRERTLYFSMAETRPGWMVRVVHNGEELLSETISENSVKMEFSAPMSRTVSFVRVEVYDEDGRCILLTNPIYYVWEDMFAGEIPPEREYKKRRRFITRHGQVAPSDYVRGEDGAPDAMYPLGEPVLSPLGREQARALGERLVREGFHGKILASPYIRTMETAEIIASVTDCPVYPCPAIREIMKTDESAQSFRGQTEEELRALFPHMAKDAHFPDQWWDTCAQTWDMVVERVRRELPPVLEEFRNDELLLVGHGASVGAMHRYFGIPDKRNVHTHTGNLNCSLTVTDPDEPKNMYVYSMTHLPYSMWTSNFVSAPERDAARFAEPWEDEIAVPDLLAACKGTKILHIGDTFSWHYPYYRALIEAVKPDIILHTGDLADEVKVGRIPGTEEEYRFKIRALLDILTESGAKEICIVPGNNDRADMIAALAPSVKILSPNSELILDGHVCRVGHELQNMTFDREYAFYGHGMRGETWDLSKNRPGVECRFNVQWGYSYVYTLNDGDICYYFDRP